MSNPPPQLITKLQSSDFNDTYSLHLFTFQTPIFLLSYPYKNYL